jgi:hypothetical protein
MIATEEIIQAYKLDYRDYGLLFPDNEYVLSKTNFIDLGDKDLNKNIISNWFMNINERRVDNQVWQSWSNARHKYFSYCVTSGTINETKQACPRIALRKEHDTEPQLQELLKYIKHSIYCKERYKYDSKYIQYLESRPFIYVQIFEHTLSEDGVYALHIFTPNDIGLYQLRYGSTYLLKNFHSFISAIEYTKENHYYE